jgi:carboxymethylenebutenolidase
LARVRAAPPRLVPPIHSPHCANARSRQFFTLATQRVDAQMITNDTTGLDAGETQVPVKDGHLPAYYARPAKGTHFPVILVNEEIFGVHEHIKDICRRLAKVGYLAVATEYYARIGDLSKMTDVPTIFKEVISK